MSERNSLEISRWASFFLTAVWQLQSLKDDRFDNMHSRHSRHRCKNRQCSVGHWVERWTEPFSWTFWLNWAGQECVTPAKLTMKLPTPFGCPFFVLVWSQRLCWLGLAMSCLRPKGSGTDLFGLLLKWGMLPKIANGFLRAEPCRLQLARRSWKWTRREVLSWRLRLKRRTLRMTETDARKIHRSWHVGGWTW